ncbi:MAG: MarR family winged helix-turn-helix transcriptional regulator [Anaerolineales bacterium]|nr:MarR family winged helix-turn-helix transcriptional regulator [Anaerolineales bacterium]
MLKKAPKKDLYEFVRQTVPCVGFNTRRATRLITQYYDKALAPAGLRSTQYSLLSALSMMGEALMQDLASMLATDRTTLTRNLSPLLKMGLIEVSAGSDRRIRLIKIAPKGISALERALPYWQKAQSRIVDSLGADNWDQIMRGLHQISMIIEEN